MGIARDPIKIYLEDMSILQQYIMGTDLPIYRVVRDRSGSDIIRYCEKDPWSQRVAEK